MTDSKITSSDQIPPRPLRPSDAKRADSTHVSTGELFTAQAAMTILEAHADLAVRTAAKLLELACVGPWLKQRRAELRPAITDVDVYDLVLELPEGHEGLTIGSSLSSVLIGADPVVLARHVLLQPSAEGRTWGATLLEPRPNESPSPVTHDCLTTLNPTVHKYISPYHNEYPGPIIVAPGDTLRIGHSLIRLHAPRASDGFTGDAYVSDAGSE